MDGENLSRRLQTVAEYVSNGARMADIGSDHGYLPIHLALSHRIEFAIAGEVALGPLSNAEHEIKAFQLEEIVMPRLADGLAAIKAADNVNAITIAGMGGSLITKILDQGQAQLRSFPELVLQPNVGAINVRKWLMHHGYQISGESILEEDDHIYEILHATKAEQPIEYSQVELMFGPHLLHHQNAAFAAKWRGVIERNQVAIDQMQAAKVPPVDKIAALQERSKLIKEALANG